MATDETSARGRTQIIDSLAEISGAYDAVLCDLWGCFHNGVTPYPAAVAALQAFRSSGGVVLLLTNAPRPHGPVRAHLKAMNAPESAYDSIVSSGDSTRAALVSGDWGRRYHIVGPTRDDGLWNDLDIERTDVANADAILCTGLFDDAVETPADYRDMIAAGVARDLPFLCANPDIVVDRGDTRLYCAGAIAQAYTAAGGRTFFFGKPHPPIYALALTTLAQTAGRAIPKERVLALGDGVATDVAGATAAGIDCVFVSGGLAAAEVGDSPEHPDAARLTQYLVSNGVSPRYTIGRLR